MKSLQLENPHRRLGAPANWNHERDGLCHTLEIWDIEGMMVSLWRPSPDELERLNRGCALTLFIQGSTHPVVALEVGREPVESPAPADRKGTP